MEHSNAPKMKPIRDRRKDSPRSVWIAVAVAAVVVHGVWLFFIAFRTAPQPSPAHPEQEMTILLLSNSGETASPILIEQAHLFDTEPLFLPTPWNASHYPSIDIMQWQPADPFTPYPPQFSRTEAGFRFDGDGAPPVSNSALEIFPIFSSAFYRSFGLADEPPHDAAEQPAGRIELISIADGQTVMEISIPEDERPAGMENLWTPAEFLLQVTEVGLLGEPVLLISSNNEEIDIYLRDIIHNRILRERIPPPGIYRAVAGP